MEIGCICCCPHTTTAHIDVEHSLVWMRFVSRIFSLPLRELINKYSQNGKHVVHVFIFNLLDCILCALRVILLIFDFFFLSCAILNFRLSLADNYLYVHLHLYFCLIWTEICDSINDNNNIFLFVSEFVTICFYFRFTIR